MERSWDELLRMEGQIRKRGQQEIYDKKIFREKLLGSWCLLWCFIGLSLLGLLFTPHGTRQRMVGIIAGTGVRKEGGQETFGGTDGKVIYLAQSDNIKNCYTCF